MNIFITGGTGFIGKHLALALADEGNCVYVLTRKKIKVEKLNNAKIIPIEGCLENSKSYQAVFDRNIDIVYHLGAIPGQKWGFSKSDYLKINTLGTKKLLEASRQKIKKFVFCSSINALIENNFKNDPYGRSKFEAEKLIKKESNFETVILRPAIVYGPGDTGGMFLKLCRMIQRGTFFLIGSGKKVLPIIFIDDLINAFLRAKTIPGHGKTLEIVDPEKINIREISQLIANHFKVKLSRIFIPVWLAKSVVPFFWLLSKISKKEQLLTNHRIDILTKTQTLNCEKWQSELGIMPKTNFSKGIGITINWYKTNGFL